MGELCFIVDLSFGIEGSECQVVYIGQEGMRLVADLYNYGYILPRVERGTEGTDPQVFRDIVYFIEVIEIYSYRSGHSIDGFVSNGICEHTQNRANTVFLR